MPKSPPWTLKEEQVILRESGKMSLVEISTQIETECSVYRSPQAIKDHWLVMKQQGRAKGTLYYREAKGTACTKCGKQRHYLRNGKCILCSKQEELDRSEERMSDIYLRLSTKDQQTYKDNELKRGSRVVAPRKKPSTLGMDARHKRKADLQHERDVEAAQIATLQRKINASKQRLRRMRKKLGENPRNNKAD